MTTKQPSYLNNRRVQQIGLAGSLVVAAASGFILTLENAKAGGELTLIVGVAFAIFWLAVMIKDSRRRRRE